jgi:hypothetical protein
LTSLSFYNDKLIARFFNPTLKKYSFDKEYLKTDIWGNPAAIIKEVIAKDIVTIKIERALSPVSVLSVEEVVTFGLRPAWRVGENKGLPDPDIIKQLQEKIAQLELQLDRVEEQLNTIGDEDDEHSLQHRYYVLKREMCELRLSVLLNQRKLARQGSLDREYLYTPDPEIAELGLQLNQLRIKRRIYDYIVGALAVSCSSHLTN